jgi:hypothetical protein
MMALVENAGFTTLRFPGGAWTDMLDLQAFRIDSLIAFRQQVGAMPTISVRLLGGRPETAAQGIADRRQQSTTVRSLQEYHWAIG